MSLLRDRIEQLAIEYHKAVDGEGEYGCNGATCPGVKRLVTFGQSCAALAGSVLPEGGWQPIETAPTDGTIVLLWNGYMQHIEKWGKYQRWNAPKWTHWKPLPDPPLREGGTDQ